MKRQELIVMAPAMVATVRNGDEFHRKNVWSRMVQCRERAQRFTPARARAELHRLVNDLPGAN
ncbi:MAG: hypothetical protein JNL91_15565 [Candidatus Accumulibacter sp.]|nr:hypothetical protein [Accumulibacter sp.]